MTATKQTLSPGWERINDIRTELFGLPIRQFPEEPRLRIAAMLNGLALYTSYLEAELRQRSRDQDFSGETAQPTTRPQTFEHRPDA